MTYAGRSKKRIVKAGVALFGLAGLVTLQDQDRGTLQHAIELVVAGLAGFFALADAVVLVRFHRGAHQPSDIGETKFFLAAWVTLFTLAAILLSGNTMLNPLFYVAVAAFFGYAGILTSAIFLVTGCAVQYLAMVVSDGNMRDWLLFVAFSCIFSILGWFFNRERRERIAARNRVDGIKDSIDSFLQEGSEQLLALQEEHRIEELNSSYRFLEKRVVSILEQAKEVFAPYTVAFFKVREGGFYRVFEAFSDSDQLRLNEDIRLEDGIIGWVVRNTKPIRIGSMRSSARTVNYYDGTPAVKSFLAVPVMLHGRLVGVLAVDSLHEEAFTADSERLLRMSALQIEEALETSQTFQTTMQQKREFRALYDASKHLHTLVGLDENLLGLLDLVATVQPCELGFVALLDDNGVLTVRAVRGLPETAVGEAVDQKSMLYWVAQHRQDLDIKRYDDKKHAAPLITKKFRTGHIRRLLAYPILTDNEIRGVVVIGTDGGPTDYEKNALEILINQGCTAISNALLFEKVRLMATTDGLTGLVNHRHFQERFTELLDRAKRYDETLSFLIIDVDFFKKVNDTYGHPVGDLVLKKVAATLRGLARSTDVVARYGGEEFAIILVQTDASAATAFAERVRHTIEDMTVIFEGGTLKVTASMGVASCPAHATEKARLIELADQALYRAKHEGRNRVMLAG